MVLDHHPPTSTRVPSLRHHRIRHTTRHVNDLTAGRTPALRRRAVAYPSTARWSCAVVIVDRPGMFFLRASL
jgi:hypothetical protein